jgi:hypothetical protein
MSNAPTLSEYEEIRAPEDLTEVEVKAGDRGVVLELFERPRAAVLVEYADSEGQTKALVFYAPDLSRAYDVIPEID